MHEGKHHRGALVLKQAHSKAIWLGQKWLIGQVERSSGLAFCVPIQQKYVRSISIPSKQKVDLIPHLTMMGGGFGKKYHLERF